MFLPDRVRAVAVSATPAPRPAMGRGWRKGLDLVNGRELEAVEKGGSVLRIHLEEQAVATRKVASGGDILNDPEFSKAYAPVDRAGFKGEFLDWAVKTYPLVVSHGVDGWIDDDLMFFGDWGLDLAQVGVSVTIWQGGRTASFRLPTLNGSSATYPGPDSSFCLRRAMSRFGGTTSAPSSRT